MEKTEIQELREIWLKKCREYSEKVDELKKLSDRLNGGFDDKLNNTNNELEQLSKDVKQALEEYHHGCKKYVSDILKPIDSYRKKWLEGVFERDCFNTNDWSNAIDHLDDLVLIIEHSRN